ncbi:MAG TPA: hemolysin family protein [Acidimicrobiales bacterium]|nr:hemolysin family protein [Acidimicrobiales bacterium]
MPCSTGVPSTATSTSRSSTTVSGGIGAFVPCPPIETALGLLAVFLLIAANAAFVANEFALVAVDRGRVSRHAEEGRAAARIAERMLERLSFHLSGAQLGITVTSLILGFIAEPVVGTLLEPVVGTVVGEGSATAVSIALALALATTFQMVTGELVPKSLAISYPVGTAYALAPVMRVYGIVVGPLVRAFNGVANWVVRRLGIEPQEELRSVRGLEELDLLFRSSGLEGTIDEESLTLLTRAVRFSEKAAVDALIPRLETVGLSVDETVADLTARAVATGYSRFPVYDGDLDQIVGVGHVKDAFAIPYERRASTPVRQIMAEALVVPETMQLSALLGLLRERATHLAVVVDEHGGTAGVITLEDVLEEIVGEIDDEHDRPAPPLTRVQRPGEWVLGGGLHRDEVFDACGFELPEGPYETLAGFVLDALGRIPEAGQRFEHEGWVVEVAGMDRLRVASVRLVAPPAEGRP